ncbi:hypothetical protein PD5205_02341 [Xanthomonas fragariae]|uniref:DUF3304 domain-containing protein n=2 Tax=Xanthomonas fragariae TaxID=48664 RepID=A0A1Y6H8W2_9XANT|nr:DUF3304 domain-containing protein [Xanthomonas fragariae]SMQ95663.1 hypothetical protein NBC2815_02329 [Xanthomonas fragariae]SMQ99606.1 hypothetical protein PD885_02368 [Xanthomonas fragariae]SMR03638.1 hypothetical protein PD5205_02341 [Xanthomonas fragariae]
MGGNSYPYGGGGSFVCCVTYPRQWRPGLTAKVRWTTSSGIPGIHSEPVWHEKVVPIERYEKPGTTLNVHFLPEGKVRLLIWNGAAGSKGYKGYKGPDAPVKPEGWPPLPPPPTLPDAKSEQTECGASAMSDFKPGWYAVKRLHDGAVNSWYFETRERVIMTARVLANGHQILYFRPTY